MSETRFILMGKFGSLNDLIGASNHNRFVGADIKRKNTNRVTVQCEGLGLFKPHGHYTFNWHLSDKRTDPDNIASAVKYIFDGLQKASVIPNDNWEYIKSISHTFTADASKGMEFVEVVIRWEDEE